MSPCSMCGECWPPEAFRLLKSGLRRRWCMECEREARKTRHHTQHLPKTKRAATLGLHTAELSEQAEALRLLRGWRAGPSRALALLRVNLDPLRAAL